MENITNFFNDMREIHPYDKLYHLLVCFTLFLFFKYVLRMDNKTTLILVVVIAVLKEIYDIIWLTVINYNPFTLNTLYESLSDVSVVLLVILVSYLMPTYKERDLVI